MMIKRRDFLKFLGVGTIVGFSSKAISAEIKHKVVVIGGGYSGSTCAKYLKLWGGESVEVTLIEKNSSYVSPILSNLVLNGQKSLSDITFSYAQHSNNYKINVINKEVSSINPDNKSITLDDSSILNYDRLVLATGIDFIQTNEYDFSKIPHAWIAGEQTGILKNQIDSMQNGDTFLLTIPKSPYRCPPGPYERACVVADYLKNKKGYDNARVIVLDENSDFVVEKDSFYKAFSSLGIYYYPNCKVTNVNDTTKAISYEENGVEKSLSAKVINVIPNQKASKLIFDLGLNDDSNFAPVDLLSYESLKVKNIHIIGDSHKSSQPKAGHIGNSEAKVCADAILRLLNGYEPYSSPKTNSACYSPISSTTATWLSAVYKYDSVKKDMVKVSFDSGSASTNNYNEMFMWAGNLFADTFR